VQHDVVPRRKALLAVPHLRQQREPSLPAGRARIRVRVEIMGSQKSGIVGKSQPVLMMINPMIFTRTRTSVAQTPVMLTATRSRLHDDCSSAGRLHWHTLACRLTVADKQPRLAVHDHTPPQQACHPPQPALETSPLLPIDDIQRTTNQSSSNWRADSKRQLLCLGPRTWQAAGARTTHRAPSVSR
jgi:hypothetical protein